MDGWVDEKREATQLIGRMRQKWVTYNEPIDKSVGRMQACVWLKGCVCTSYRCMARAIDARTLVWLRRLKVSESRF